MVFRQSATRVLIAATALAGLSGCATQAHQEAAARSAQQVEAVQARLAESERTNGRLTARIEELEDSVFLLQDRVDANRIALQRRGVMGPQASGNTYTVRGPSPSAETHYNAPGSYPTSVRADQGHPVTRIPLGGGTEPQAYEDSYVDQVPTSQIPPARAVAPTTSASNDDAELVIGENEFRRFEERYGGADAPSPTKSSGSSSKKQAQAPVTDERLATTKELDGAAKPAAKSAPPAAPKEVSAKDGLTTYKDALAAYRGGDYASALGGFERFLSMAPQADYVDNALYWIGECHFGLGKFDQAVAYFQRVMAEQPDGNKVPDAMLKMSLAFDRTGRGEQAAKLLEDLTRQFPATNAGRLASQKLAERP